MRTNTCFVVILMIFGIRLTTSSTTIRPRTPPGVGSCKPMSRLVLLAISRIVTGKRVSLLSYRAVCTVPGVYRGTVSQYTIYTHLSCFHSGCDEEEPFYIIRFILMCHYSTKSFMFPEVKAYRGSRAIWTTPYDFYRPPPSRTDCGMCADYYSRYNSQLCGGNMYYYIWPVLMILLFLVRISLTT